MQENSRPVLYLCPTPISERHPNLIFSRDNISKIIDNKAFIVENIKTTRRFLKKLDPEIEIDSIQFVELNKHKDNQTNSEIIELFKHHNRIGLMSEAGLPCIADPGNLVVRYAHSLNWKVVPIDGPSSIILALISSGLNGQSFKFNGYLPLEKDKKKTYILQLEKESSLTTQLFIEAPYRNDSLFQDLLQILHPQTFLLIASDIQGEKESIRCMSIAEWKKNQILIGKTPCMFAIGK